MAKMLAFLFVSALAVASTKALDCGGQTTQMQYDFGGFNWALSAHLVACPIGKLLQSHRLVVPAPGFIYYDYTCCQAEVVESLCGLTTTEYTANNNGKLDALMFHDVNCPPNYKMRGFMYEQLPGTVFFRYVMNCCCQVTEYSACKDLATPASDYWGNTILALGYHNVQCPSTDVMREFKTVHAGTFLSVWYQCCTVPYVPCNDPTDQFKDILSCSMGLICTYSQTVGVSNTREISQGVTQHVSITKEVSKGLDRSFRKVTKSHTTGKDWSQETTESKTYSEETTITAQFACPAGTAKCTLQQIIGHCGGYTVNAPDFRLIDGNTGQLIG